MTSDLFDLQRFVAAQTDDYARACAELRAGRKTTHWMWYVFPQMRGLGMSDTARLYGISGLPEARAYLADPILGSRLIEATELVFAIPGKTIREIFGVPDDMKFHSSMTLFAHAADGGGPFARAIATLCGGTQDEATLKLIGTA